MANTKIDSIKLSESTETYDIDLPGDATPSITSLTTSTLDVTGSSNLTDVITTGSITVASSNLYIVKPAVLSFINSTNSYRFEISQPTSDDFLINATKQPTVSMYFSDNFTLEGSSLSTNIDEVAIHGDAFYVNTRFFNIEGTGSYSGYPITTTISEQGIHMLLSTGPGYAYHQSIQSFSVYTGNVSLNASNKGVITLGTDDNDYDSAHIHGKEKLYLTTGSMNVLSATYFNSTRMLNIGDTMSSQRTNITAGSGGLMLSTTVGNITLSKNDTTVSTGYSSSINLTSSGISLTTSIVTSSTNVASISLSSTAVISALNYSITVSSTNIRMQTPSSNCYIDLSTGLLTLSHVTPHLYLSTGNIVAYPGCGYSATSDGYAIPAVSTITLMSQAGATSILAMTGSSLTRNTSISFSGGNNGRIYTVFAYESGDHGELRITRSSTVSTNENTIVVASGDDGYHGNSWLNVTFVVPPGLTYYLWGKRLTNMHYCTYQLRVYSPIA